MFAAPVSLGTVSNLEAEVSAALAPAHAEALAAVRAAEVKHADETGWKRAGKLCWLWAGATAAVAASTDRTWFRLVMWSGSSPTLTASCWLTNGVPSDPRIGARVGQTRCSTSR